MPAAPPAVDYPAYVEDVRDAVEMLLRKAQQIVVGTDGSHTQNVGAWSLAFQDGDDFAGVLLQRTSLLTAPRSRLCGCCCKLLLRSDGGIGPGLWFSPTARRQSRLSRVGARLEFVCGPWPPCGAFVRLALPLRCTGYAAMTSRCHAPGEPLGALLSAWQGLSMRELTWRREPRLEGVRMALRGPLAWWRGRQLRSGRVLWCVRYS